MKFKKKQFALLFCIIIAICGVTYAYKQYNKPHRSIEYSKAKTISAKALFKAFHADESKANTLYLDKVIQLSGLISDIESAQGKTIIILEDSPEGSVRCTLSSKGSKQIELLKKGQLITIKGICTGYLFDVILVRCQIIQ